MTFSLIKTGALALAFGAVLSACTVVVEDDTRPLPPRPGPGPICTQQYDPVCGEDRRGNLQTYGNACVARSEGASIVYGGECRRGGGGGNQSDRFCTREYAPVCATRRGRERTFGNACEADVEGYRVIYSGQCARG